MKLKEIIDCLEALAPPALQESYDNSGLIIGSPEWDITAALICLDSTPDVVAEAVRKKCNLIIAHHPIVFSGLKKITGKNYIERTVIEAIKNDVAIYAIHTNLDNVSQGVNKRIADKLGLERVQILQPQKDLLKKLTVFVPDKDAELVRNSLFAAGAGHIGNYDECSYGSFGNGTYRPGNGSNPTLGELGKRLSVSETKIEVILPHWLTHKVIAAMKGVHPYEEVAFDILSLQNELESVGSGMIGELASDIDAMSFLLQLKKTMQAGMVRHTAVHKQKLRRIAVCGGSGSFLLSEAVKAGADVLVTADFKYHQFFDADGRIIIADIGHYESEQFTIQLLGDWLKVKMPTFATHFTEVNTNPVSYL